MTPSVMGCPMLQIVEGCAHGKCRFCSIYADAPFKMVPEKEIDADLDELAKTIRPDQTRINLIGGNPYTLPMKKLIPLLEKIKEKLPNVKSFGGFCRISDIAAKTDEELPLLREYGVNDLSIGAESGWDEALAFMQKGHTAQDVAEQGQRLHEAGIDFTYFYLTGMAGAGKGQQNAIESAKAYSAAAPGHILVVCMTPTNEWPLAEDIKAGRWTAPSEVEMVEEIRTFIENLDCNTYVNCSHDTDILRFQGVLPGDKTKMLELIDHLAPKVSESASRRMREMLHRATF